EHELSDATTLLQLLQERGLDPRVVVVEYNYEIIPRDRYHEVMLGEGDNVEIILDGRQLEFRKR
ncbi:MAG: sulfur carrier protein ThiS, partial [Candidatus Thermochlorobacter sp.]